MRVTAQGQGGLHVSCSHKNKKKYPNSMLRMLESDIWSNNYYEHYLYRVCTCWLMFSLCEGQKVCAVLLADQGTWWWKVRILWHNVVCVSEAHDCNYQRGGGWVWFGMTSPFIKEKWEKWCRKYSLQSGITTLRLENWPTQIKNTELLIPMAAKWHTTSNPHNCTTATEVEGGN